ncbi:PREDICTED: patatin-like phospholipase domain-containing protein 4 [Myotis brandtii]|uniref:patatin-like phospholipase domain-containing protein 4 n=1 Tax=Myotis brandtii TaxID=109478 RepID=UPI0003BB93BE|nr:PREDICTED: patatin-like phospholipase domain-containing protein 4 [Myotis brandtii]
MRGPERPPGHRVPIPRPLPSAVIKAKLRLGCNGRAASLTGLSQMLQNKACGMKHINLSFAACGFLGIYHLGAASAFCKHGQKLLKDVKAFAGASAGSLVASVLLTAPEKIEVMGWPLGRLPQPEIKIQQQRRMLTLTVFRFLPQVLLASSFLPLYAGLKPVEYKGQTWVDGGFTNSLPILPVGRTVTISPFCGRLDISPQDKGQLGVYVSIANQDILVSVANLVRLNQALFPPGQREMESLYRRGFRDAAGFLLKENWFE